MITDPCEARDSYQTSDPQRAVPAELINPKVTHHPKVVESRVHDEQILAAVASALHHTGYAQLRTVKSYCHHGRVILQGRITTHYLKQVALEVVRSIANVKDVDNDLHVICG